MSDALLYETEGRIVRITLNRPEVHNAFSPEMIVRLARAWRDFEADDDLRVAIISGAGDKAFGSGADLKRLIPLESGARQPEDEWDRALTDDPELLEIAVLHGSYLSKPVVAAINGHCLAGAAELVWATDIRIASPAATFGLSEVTLGLVPAGGSMVRLPRQIPYTSAMYMLLTGESIDAETALRIGLVNAIVSTDELQARAMAIAERIANNAPLAVRTIKQTVAATLGQRESDGFAIEADAKRKVMQSQDAREGAAAFREKRPPRYTGA
jgi:enoyl-CoA hydratase